MKAFQKPDIHLIIPQLLQPLKLWQKDFQFLPESPHLSQLLSKFDLIPSHNSMGLDASLFASLRVSQNNQLPIAYFRYQTHRSLHSTESIKSDIDHLIALNEKSLKKGGGGYKNKTDSKMILCADPVHFEVGLNDITLTQHITDLTEEEAKQCIEALNQHFKQDGLDFIYGSPSEWYLILKSETNLDTTPLLEVLNKNIAHYSPVSKDMNWQVIQNEVQMILHMLPLNQKREVAGLPALNSLWFYGGGKPEGYVNVANTANTLKSVYSSNEKKGMMLSIASGCDYSPLPKKAPSFLRVKSGKHLFILDQLMLPAIYDDVLEYQKQLTHLDSYLAPIIQAWKDEEIDLTIDSCTGKLLKPIKKSRWQFWSKRSPSLTEIATEIANETG